MDQTDCPSKVQTQQNALERYNDRRANQNQSHGQRSLFIARSYSWQIWVDRMIVTLFLLDLPENHTLRLGSNTTESG